MAPDGESGVSRVPESLVMETVKALAQRGGRSLFRRDRSPFRSDRYLELRANPNSRLNERVIFDQSRKELHRSGDIAG